MIEIIVDWCKGCDICIHRCPVDALEKSEELNKRGVYPPKLKEENDCTHCRLCELLCPDFAITVTTEEGEDDDKKKKSKLILGGIVNEV